MNLVRFLSSVPLKMFLVLGGLPVFTHASTVVWWEFFPETIGEGGWNIEAAYQTEEGVVLSYQVGDLLPFTHWAASVPTEIAAPSIVICDARGPMEISQADLLEWTLLDPPDTSFDPSRDEDGWVLSDPFGWLAIRDYPWVFALDWNGWIYVSEAGIIDQTNSYWIWSLEANEWFFTTRRIYPWCYGDRNGWRLNP